MPLINLWQEDARAREAARERAVKKVPVRDVPFPKAFPVRLAYGCPAHGNWTIMHMGVLVPEGHVIYVCAQGCLRGVSMSAYELGFEKHFSTVCVEDNDLLEGDAEAVLIEGVAMALERLPKLPRAALVTVSCVHHYMGTDFPYCLRELKRRYPGVDFLDCYMTPITREDVPPDNKMRAQLMRLLKPVDGPKRGALFAGNLNPMDEDSDLAELLKLAGEPLYQASAAESYEAYQEQARARFAFSVHPLGKQACEVAGWHLGIPSLALPVCYGDDEIRSCLEAAAQALALPGDKLARARARWDAARGAAASAVEATAARLAAAGASLAVDAGGTPRPAGLARRFVEAGARVCGLYLDSFAGAPQEKADCDWLRERAPDIPVCPMTDPADVYRERKAPDGSAGPVVAVGQRAAWYTGTAHMAEIVEGGTGWGWQGLAKLCRMIDEALVTDTDVPAVIQVKALGCQRAADAVARRDAAAAAKEAPR
ncbi:MAG: hypothetical protein HUK26_02055 [Duodenibacillus sp.]|nr:hypothetical protein [Duodenibacillus sp.]